MGDIRSEHIVRVPIKAIETPRQGMCEVRLDHWWVVDPKTDSVIFYKRTGSRQLEYSSPQCNRTKAIAVVVLRGIWETDYGFEVRLIPAAFIPIWMRGDIDFGYNLKPLLEVTTEDDQV